MTVFYNHVALSDLDYTAVNLIITFPANSTDGDMQCQSIAILDDNVLESVEEFNITINTTNAVLVTSDVVVSIIDDEG